MSERILTCVNHPDTETRLACSSCGDPICTRCMRQGAVGQKCPRCARTPRRARALGKPVHYVRSVGAGGALAVVGGLVFVQLIAMIGFGTLILSGLLGFGVGRTVRWGARGQTQQPFAGIAAALAVLGILVGYLIGFGTFVPGSFWLLLAYPVAAWFAVRGLAA